MRDSQRTAGNRNRTIQNNRRDVQSRIDIRQRVAQACFKLLAFVAFEMRDRKDDADAPFFDVRVRSPCLRDFRRELAEDIRAAKID